jgi:hypothetical protein
LKSRTALLRDAQHDEHAITFIVETFRAPGGVRGQLTVRKPDGELSVREVPGASCSEMESAMALIGALMVDPLASGASGVRRPREQEKAAPVALVGPARTRWRLGVEHRLIAQGGVAPKLAWGQAGRLVVGRETGAWRPSVALSAHLTRSTSAAPEGSAELEWAAAQLSVCPLSAPPASAWDLRACGAFQLGRLRGLGFQTADPASQSLLWSAAAVLLEGRLRLRDPLWLGLEAGVTLPFTRERFYLEPDRTLYRVPAWAGSVGFGVGLRFF